MTRMASAIGLITLLLATAFCLGQSTRPSLIEKSENGIKYLWDWVDRGQFWNVVPGHPATTAAWTRYLKAEGETEVREYYKRHFQNE